MIIGIIGALENEIRPLFEQLEAPTKTNIAHAPFASGMIHDKQVVVATSGIGKVNAALCAQLLITEFHCTQILNIGTAGALDNSLKTGDIVISSEVIEHSVDLSPLGYKQGQIPGMAVLAYPADARLISFAEKVAQSFQNLRYVKGTIVSGDSFIASNESKDAIHTEFNALAVEMEGAAIGHVCFLNDIPFVVIRSISDGADTDASESYEAHANELAQESCELAGLLVKAL